jgi:hypothetical protein
METSRTLLWERKVREGIVQVHSETFSKGTPTYIVSGPYSNSSELSLMNGYSEEDAINFAITRCGRGLTSTQ